MTKFVGLYLSMKLNRYMLLASAIGALCSFAISHAAGRSAPVVSTSSSEARVLENLIESFNKQTDAKRIPKFDVIADERPAIGRFADQDAPFDIVVTHAVPDAYEHDALARRFPSTAPQPAVFLIGQRRLAVIVNTHAAMEQITFDQIGTILSESGKGMVWSEIGGKGGKVKCYGEGKNSWSRDLLKRRCMGFKEQVQNYTRSGFRAFRDDFEECLDLDDVVNKVSHDGNGIGFVQYRGERLEGVRVLAVAPVDKDRAIPLTEGVRLQNDYPLTEPLLMYLHPNAPPVARSFCEFAVSGAGAEIAARYGVSTPFAQEQAEVADRLARLKAGEGDPVHAVGTPQATFLMNDLPAEFAKAKSLVRFKYAGQPELAAVGDFLDGRDLLVTLGPIADKDLKAATNRWNAMAEGIEEYRLAGRAVAVVVHSLNKLDSLTAEQLRAIFTGKVKDWTVLAAINSTAFGSEVHCYGVDRPDPAFELFCQKLGFRDVGRVTRMKTSADVITKLPSDPQGIAFVNLASLPEDLKKARLKVLAIGDGQNAVYPSPGAVLDATYPLSEQFYLYLNPRASRAARDFVEFMTTPSSCDQTYHKNGFIPPQPADDKNAATEPATKPATTSATASSK